jgi:hypothetical protein
MATYESDLLRQPRARRGVFAVVAIRFLPVAPFTMVNIVLGAARIKLWHFVLGTAIGLTPGFLARSLRQLGTHFGQSSRVRTWPSWRPLFELDRLWVHPPEALAAVWAHASPRAQRASDHLPLVGMIKIG